MAFLSIQKILSTLNNAFNKIIISLPFAQRVSSKVRKWAKKPIETQEKVFRNLISSGTKTAFGQDHDFISINSYQDFKKRVPIRDYEALLNLTLIVWFLES